MQLEQINTFHNVIQFKKADTAQGLIEIDHLYLDFNGDNECFIQNHAKQLLNNDTWYTSVQFKIKGDQDIRSFIFDHYSKIAHELQRLDPQSIDEYQQDEQQTGQILYSKWFKVNDFLAIQLSKVNVKNAASPYIN